MRAFLTELRRRNVHRTAIAYLATGWLIIEVLQNVLPIFDAPAWLNQAIVLILIAGLPLAIWLSWEFELTTGGIKRADDVDPGESFSDRTGRIVDFVIIGILGVAVVLLLSDRYLARDIEFEELTSLAEIRSLAVLPFEDFSPAHDQEHLAVGITDTLLHALAQVKGLKVIARTSAFTYKDRDDVPISTIGEELGVGAVLEGSVQRQDDRLRITAQLIRVSDQSHLWSENFDMEMGDIFRIQDEIANEVAGILQPQSDGETLEIGTTSVEAYEHFVRGRDLWRQRSPTDIAAAIEELESAVKLDPQFAPAHAELALAYWFSSEYGGQPFDEVRLLIEREVERALELDPNYAWAWAAKGQLVKEMGDRTNAEGYYRKAIELDPNESYFYQWLSLLLASDLTRIEDVKRLRRRAYELDPRNTFIVNNYALFLAWSGDKEGALEMHRRAGELEPEKLRQFVNRTLTHQLFGEYDEAVRVILPLMELKDTIRSYQDISRPFLILGDQEAALAWFAEAQKRSRAPLPYSPYWFMRPQDHERLIEEAEAAVIRSEGAPRTRANLAFAYNVVGRYQEAIELLDELLADDDGEGEPAPRYYGPLLMRMVAAKAVGDDAYIKQMAPRLRKPLEIAREKNWQAQSATKNLARLAALEGDRERALHLLRESVKHGFLEIRWLRYLKPLWGEFHSDPEFRAILADIEARQREQRASLYADGIRFPPGYEPEELNADNEETDIRT